MAQCKHGNPYRTAPDAVINRLPECQAGAGRHKCAVCAYNEGILVAKGKEFSGPSEQCPDGVSVPRSMLKGLPDSQGGPQRHTCVYTAYRMGLEAGQVAGVIAEFEEQIAKLDKTEAMAHQKIRIGQQLFRRELVRYWKGECPLTGITDNSLLRASHIKPWSQCNNDSERLNVYNGILLSSLHDASFDAGLLSFTDNGEPLFSRNLSQRAFDVLSKSSIKTISFTDRHLPFLDWHRKNCFN